MEYKDNRIKNFFINSLNKKHFSGSSLSFSVLKEKKFKRCILSYGKTDKFADASSVKNDIFFDLASLTKPLVTVLSLLCLADENKIELESTLDSFFPAKMFSDKKDISIFQLLSHSSGLPAHRPYFQKLKDYPLIDRKETLIQWILAEKRAYPPGTQYLYSDLGFILLGDIIEKVSGTSLDSYWLKKIAQPLHVEKYFCFPQGNRGCKGNFVTTGVCPWSKKKLHGLVHDDNCRAMGGIAGHAGLFGTSEGILLLCENILLQEKGILSHPSYDNKIWKTVFKRLPSTTWCLGFDSPSENFSSSGKYFSKKSRGHLGFTGTSFWIDPENKICIVFLTNRVLLSKKEVIQKIRPLIHDIVMEELLFGNNKATS